MLAGGEESRDTFPYRPNVVLAVRLGSSVVDFPGDHTGYAYDPGGLRGPVARGPRPLTVPFSRCTCEAARPFVRDSLRP